MTGQKNRFSTTEKLWDLDDKQLKTPEHDALVLWLMDNWKNYNINFNHCIPFVTKKQNKLGEWYDDDTPLTLWKISVKSEYPVMSSKSFLAGYIDIAILGEYSFYSQDEINQLLENSERIRTDKSVGHYIEIKPYIDSFGAVLRQINSYKKFTGNTGKYYLFTLDNRFDSQFESQEITVLHPPSDFNIDEIMEYYGLG